MALDNLLNLSYKTVCRPPEGHFPSRCLRPRLLSTQNLERLVAGKLGQGVFFCALQFTFPTGPCFVSYVLLFSICCTARS
jgi:hypothetical protein